MRLLLSGLALLSLAPSALGAQARIPTSPYEALSVPPDSIGTCRVSEESKPGSAKPTRTIRFNAETFGKDRSIRVVEYPSDMVEYLELVAGMDGQAGTLHGVVAHIDSSGGISGNTHFAKHVPGDPRAPVPTERPLTVSELKQIPLMVNWIRMRCGDGRRKHLIEIDEIRQ